MAFFSKELSVSAVAKNTLVGLCVMFDEWYWLCSKAIYDANIQRLYKKKAFLESESDLIEAQELDQQIAKLIKAHDDFRDKQLEVRLVYIDN